MLRFMAPSYRRPLKVGLLYALALLLVWFIMAAGRIPTAHAVSIANGDVGAIVNTLKGIPPDGSGNTVIDLAANGTYTVTSPYADYFGQTAFPALYGNVTINGNGATLTRASGAAAFRFFHIPKAPATLTINNLTINGGSAPGQAGGVILNFAGNIVLTNVTLTNNLASSLGGAIYHDKGTLQLNGVTANNNSVNGNASTSGGVIGVLTGTVTIGNSTFTSNSASPNTGSVVGGALYLRDGAMTISNSKFDSNVATGGGAIGIGNLGGVEKPKLTINGTNFINNKSQTTVNNAAGGGAIYVASGSLAISGNSLFKGNTAFSGGAIFSEAETTLDITNGTFDSNQAVGYSSDSGGGAIASLSKATINNSTFTNNSAPGGGPKGPAGGFGGAVYSHTNTVAPPKTTPSMTISNSTFTGNTTPTGNSSGGFGGALYNFGAIQLTINNSYFANNVADYGGGVLYNEGGKVTITSSTFVSNSGKNASGGALASAGTPNVPNATVTLDITNATFFGNTAGAGGAITNASNNGSTSVLTVTNSTFANNSANGQGGGFTIGNTKSSTGASATATLRNTLISGSNGGNCGSNSGSGVAFSAGASNLVTGNAAECGTGTTSVADLKLAAAVADNGGAVQTLALLAGSPAIDVANAQFCPSVDARGYGRSNTCDVGAFELNGVAAPLPASYNVTLLAAPVRVAIATNSTGTRLTASGNSAPDNPTAASSVSLQIGGTNGIPATASGVVGVLTNIGCTGGGNFRFWTGTTVPNAVNLNVPGAQSSLNLSTNFTTQLDSNGKVSLGLAGAANTQCGYAVDVIGYLNAPASGGGGFALLGAPARLAIATASSGTLLTASGNNAPDNAPAASSVSIQARGSSGIPSDATGIFGVLTNIGCTGGGNLRLWSGTNVPDAVNLNVPGANSALNLSTGFVASLDSSGKVTLGLAGAAGVKCGYALDVIGYISPSGNKLSLLPVTVRVASTTNNGQVPLLSNGGTAPSGSGSDTLSFQSGGLNGIPNGAKGIFGVFTNVGCTAGGNFRLWSGASVPNAVNLNVPGANPRLNLSTGFVTSLTNNNANLGFASSAGNSCGFAVDVIGYLS